MKYDKQFKNSDISFTAADLFIWEGETSEWKMTETLNQLFKCLLIHFLPIVYSMNKLIVSIRSKCLTFNGTRTCQAVNLEFWSPYTDGLHERIVFEASPLSGRDARFPLRWRTCILTERVGEASDLQRCRSGVSVRPRLCAVCLLSRPRQRAL